MNDDLELKKPNFGDIDTNVGKNDILPQKKKYKCASAATWTFIGGCLFAVILALVVYLLAILSEDEDITYKPAGLLAKIKPEDCFTPEYFINAT